MASNGAMENSTSPILLRPPFTSSARSMARYCGRTRRRACARNGLGWDPDGSLWCTESIYRSFFKMDRKNGHISKQAMLPALAPEVDGIVQVPHGMTVWNRQFWFSVAETGEVYRTPLPM